jgi:hypothetical protein
VANEELIKELDVWKKELVDEVVGFYRNGDSTRGRLAYDRWKSRFLAFLKKHVPGEDTRFIDQTTHMVFFVDSNASPYEMFMDDYGRTCLAFIAELQDALRKERITPKTSWIKLPTLRSSSTKVDSKKTANTPRRGRIPWKTLLRVALGIALLALCAYVYYLPQVQSWVWLQEHPYRLGLYGASFLIVLGVSLSIIIPKYWKYWLGTFCVGSTLVLVQLLGK